ncbi:calcium/proton exchanger [Fonsecaea pedrosoi CBS 271.37]|uniref:Calcium/proton exchanger n=1 Tax=Fonsecaea pedrosoi CBS 271.37 TaxID=1442368 RepID=A0A0D2GHL7_9EURO|nr:calcium/proton exchanger [Fonsecaea pedrosoi CBS 271.37]KIW78030.1 calcium/proton exchanger [Fonsecaea pedrosoi CBS 271.37]
MIPLPSIVETCTLELSATLNPVLGGILHATFANTTELVLGLVALRYHELQIVQATILGNILLNLVFFTGCCCLAGGLKFRHQDYNSFIVSHLSIFAVILIGILIMPTALASTTSSPPANGKLHGHDGSLTLGLAIVLLLVYCAYLYFQVSSHADLFDDDEFSTEVEESDDILHPLPTGILLSCSTCLIVLYTHNILNSIPGMVSDFGVSKNFIGFIIFPIIANASGLGPHILVARKNRLPLAFGCILATVIQIILFVVPVLIIAGQIAGMDELNMAFDPVAAIAVFIASLIAVLLLQSGLSTYFDGILLLALYSVIVMTLYDVTEPEGLGPP